MKRRSAVRFIVLALLAPVAIAAWYALKGRDGSGTSVVLICIDTLRADHVGCYGYSVQTSPNIDRLAADGVRFTNAFSQSSWTLPSHMSMMTSQYPSVHGVGPHQRALAQSTPTLAEILSKAGYETAAFVSWVFVGKSWGFGKGFDSFAELWGASRERYNPSGGAFSARQVTDSAIQWIKGEHRNPFFLFVHYFDPHMNYSPPAPFDSMFDSDYDGPASGEWIWIAPYIKWLNQSPKSIDERDLRHIVALYDGEIRYVDQQVRRLLDALEESGKLKKCLVVLTSDHGEEFNDHGSMEGHGWTLYDEILHVPLIMWQPGRLPRGAVIDSTVALIDIAPTILNLAGISAPGTFQGRSLSATMFGAASEAARRFLFAETYRFNHKQAVRGSRYELIHTEDTGVGKGGVRWAERWELFDIRKDPREQNDIFDEDSPVAKVLADQLKHLTLFRPGAEQLGEPVEIPEEDLRLLRSLGYVE